MIILFILLLVLLFAQVILVLSEYALVSLRYKMLTKSQKKGRLVEYFLKNKNLFVTKFRFTNAVLNILMGFVLFPLSLQIAKYFNISTFNNFAIFGLFAVLIFLFVLFRYVFFVALPKSIAFDYPIKTLSKTTLASIIIFLVFSLPTNLIMFFSRKILGDKRTNFKDKINNLDTQIQLRALGIKNESISSEQFKIIKNTIKISQLDITDAMIPRNQVVYLDVQDDIKYNLEQAKKSGHTRLPLCDGNLDNCLGVINIKDIFNRKDDEDLVSLKSINRQILRLSEKTPLENALASLRKFGMHMALVEDEFGGVIGVITLENLLAELVGKIRDEFDTIDNDFIKPLKNNHYEISGLAPLHLVEETLDINFKTKEISTFGGFITKSIGKIPTQSQVLDIKSPKLKIIIKKADKRRVITSIVLKQV